MMKTIEETRHLLEPCSQMMQRIQQCDPAVWSRGQEHPPALAQAYTFLPGLAEQYLTQQDLPIYRELAILFVDMADSTSALVQHAPDIALATLQQFMRVVTDVAVAHCGDVKDYEGDGALLYFESIVAATAAALAIRAALRTTSFPNEVTLQARFSLNVGPVAIGLIGSPLRRSVSVVGAPVSIAARLLKQVLPDGIITTQAVVERLHTQAPDLAAQFQLWNATMRLKGFEDETITAYAITENEVRAEEEWSSCHQTFSVLSSLCHRIESMSGHLH